MKGIAQAHVSLGKGRNNFPVDRVQVPRSPIGKKNPRTTGQMSLWEKSR